MFLIFPNKILSPKDHKAQIFIVNNFFEKYYMALSSVLVYYLRLAFVQTKKMLTVMFLVVFNFLKNVGIRNFSGPYIPAFGLNTEI